MNHCRHLAVVGLVLALLFAPVASGLVGATTASGPVTATATPERQPSMSQHVSTVSLVESNVTSGSSFEYELDEYDRIENFAVELTGRVGTEADVDRGTVSSDGGSISLPIAGTMEPTGPAGGEPELTLTARTESQTSEYIDGRTSIGIYGQSNAEVRLTRTPGTIGSIRTYHTRAGGPGAVVDVYIVEGEGPDATYGEGTLVKEGWEVPNQEGWQTIDIEPYTTNNSAVTVEFVTTRQSERSFVTRADGRWDDNETRASWDGSLLTMAYRLEVVSASPSDVSVTADDGAEATFGDFESGERSKSRAIDLSTNATELTVNYAGGDTIEWSLSYTERTASVAPGVSVNGNQVNASRTLAPGETVSLPVDPAWIRPGTNTVVVTGGASLSEDAPAPVVDLRYTHDTVGLAPETPEPTPIPDDSDEAPSDNDDGGGGGAPLGDDSDNDDNDDNDDDSRSSGGSGGSGGSSGGVSSVSNAADDPTPVEVTVSATPSPTPTATPSPTATPAVETIEGDPTGTDTVVVDVSFQPQRISTNVQAIVVVTVQNPQSVEDTHTVDLELDGQVVETREVTVPAQSQIRAQFAYNVTEPGTYTASVDGETATLTVVDPEQSPGTSTQFPGFTPLTVLVALLGAGLLARRR